MYLSNGSNTRQRILPGFQSPTAFLKRTAGEARLTIVRGF